MATHDVAVVSLSEKLSLINDHWSPRVVAQLNNYQFKLAKVEGEFVWHNHPDTDEAFLVLDGLLEIDLREPDQAPSTISLGPGELTVIPRGMDHRPRAKTECHIMLLEPQGVVNTGEAGGTLTAENDRWI